MAAKDSSYTFENTEKAREYERKKSKVIIRSIFRFEKKIVWIKAIIDSMTNEERMNPSLINGSRKKRISIGCGRPVNEINQLLFTSERLMTRKEGLPGRDWYKHHIYAPGFYTGYGVKTIPGVREAIEQGNYTLLEEQIDVAADVINGISDRIHSIVSIMGK